jgi:hypothetical protein
MATHNYFKGTQFFIILDISSELLGFGTTSLLSNYLAEALSSFFFFFFFVLKLSCSVLLECSFTILIILSEIQFLKLLAFIPLQIHIIDNPKVLSPANSSAKPTIINGIKRSLSDTPRVWSEGG